MIVAQDEVRLAELGPRVVHVCAQIRELVFCHIMVVARSPLHEGVSGPLRQVDRLGVQAVRTAISRRETVGALRDAVVRDLNVSARGRHVLLRLQLLFPRESARRLLRTTHLFVLALIRPEQEVTLAHIFAVIDGVDLALLGLA